MSAPCSIGAPQPHGRVQPFWLALLGSIHKPVELGNMSDASSKAPADG